MSTTKSNKKKKEAERVPKHVNIRLSYRDYEKLLGIAEIATKMKEDKDSKKILNKVLAEFDDEISADKFLNLVSGLPSKERTLEKFRNQAPRAAPARLYFTDPEKSNKNVLQLYDASKKWTKDKLRYDQAKETCPTDVRVMFYAYIRGKGLVEDGNPDIIVDKLLKKLAPNVLSGVKHVKRNNGSLIWKICSEIRGKESKKSKKEESSEDEAPPRKGKKYESSESEDSDEESEDSEPVPRRKPKRK